MLSSCLPSKATDVPLPYTASPWKLLYEDIILFFRVAWSIPGLLFPFSSYQRQNLDELAPTPRNMGNAALQIVLSLLQIVFLVSIPVLFICMIPALWIGIYMVGVVWVNKQTCRVLVNRGSSVLVSNYPELDAPEHRHEHWIFINGIATGQKWLQMNIDRLGLTFGRKVTGVQNPTAGLVFDIIQCMIQRAFSYPTDDVRKAYSVIRAALLNSKHTKVVLILHSQGGIEGGLIADWLLDEIPQDLLRKLEIYTFANGANHFNNPYRVDTDAHANDGESTPTLSRLPSIESDSTILHIEHYANSQDLVSLWGVLNFTSVLNRYNGQVFVRPGTGHLLNQHYLNNMFTLGSDGKVLDSNPFMEMEIEVPDSAEEGSKGPSKRVRVKDVSRLWLYRNGGSPK
ncbi:hypothetical protein BJY04DRAFT_96062 [Aspergillus karnatakaensis]|uniref:uncharacterized protein n=1 Tax=Aspergillus karnatakaensis TaxID=1810916 RepID=UPI003CCCC12C